MRTPYQGRYFYIRAWTALGLESCQLRVASRQLRGAAPLTSRTGWPGIDTRFADFSRSVSPGKPLSGGAVARPSPHSRTAGPNSTNRPRKFCWGGGKETIRWSAWLRVGRVSAKSPTLRLRSGQAFSQRTREMGQPANLKSPRTFETVS